MTDETLFLHYIDAVDRGERPDIDKFCESAEDPEELRKTIECHDSLGTKLGRFKLIHELGSGGFGSVFLAHDPDLNRQVAIKVMSGKEWARNEARSLARLRHPNIVEVFEVNDEYLVMEYVRGKPIEPIGAPHDRLEILIQLADAVAYAHSEGVLSRDIKPDNVLVTEEGQVKLIDFSIAHIDSDDTDLNITHSLIASPAYLAPEQIESGETGASPRSDQFSLGVLAYEFLSGTHPFRAKNGGRKQVLDAIARCAPLSPSGLSRDLQNILLKTLELDPRRRYSDVAALRDDLSAALELRPVSVSRSNPLRILRRHKRAIALTSALLLAIFVPQIAQHFVRRGEIREMPLESPSQVERVLSALMTFSDERTKLHIQARLADVPATPEWAATAWRFQAITGSRTSIDLGRVYVPEGAQIERLDGFGSYSPVELSPFSPLPAGYYRCIGQEFRKIDRWDTAVTIEPVVPDMTGSSIINGVRATEPIIGEDGNVLVLTLDKAMEHARKKGGRLPRVAELVKMGVLDGPAEGEWISDYLETSDSLESRPVDMDNYYKYEFARERAGAENPRVGAFISGMMVRTNIPHSADGVEIPTACFRVVFPLDAE